MNRIFVYIAFSILWTMNGFAQTNPALAMSESLAYTARFNSIDTRQLDILSKLKPSFLITHLTTDNQKNTFWLNVYNSMMLIFLKDTTNQGVYTRFYKTKNIVIAGKSWSLFQIEHEFLLAGKKMKTHGFRKSRLDTTWIKLRPSVINPKVLFCMYRGMYGYPPFQTVENGDIDLAFYNVITGQKIQKENVLMVYDWLKPYKKIIPEVEKLIFDREVPLYIKTPEAVHIKNFYPRYDGVKFKEEEINPWLKK